MKRIEMLKKRQAMLKEEIINNLDLLIGTINKSPAMKNHGLTTKINGKTISKYVRKGLVTKVTKMTQSNKKVHSLILKLSEVNWEILKLETK